MFTSQSMLPYFHLHNGANCIRVCHFYCHLNILMSKIPHCSSNITAQCCYNALTITQKRWNVQRQLQQSYHNQWLVYLFKRRFFFRCLDNCFPICAAKRYWMPIRYNRGNVLHEENGHRLKEHSQVKMNINRRISPMIPLFFFFFVRLVTNLSIESHSVQLTRSKMDDLCYLCLHLCV